MKNILQIAAAEIGVKEVPGDEHSKRIVDYAREAGFTSITDDETPWCSIFINWCCEKAGLQRTHKANARSWLSVGMPINNPQPGDIVIFWRDSPGSWQGHVGIFMGYSKNLDKVFTLGGNQRNSVSVQAYDTKKVLGFRRLSSRENVDIPSSNPVLKLNSSGEEVAKLQSILNAIGYECGSVDGVFGSRTEAALKALQEAEGIESDGIYGTNTQTLFENIYQR